MRIFLTKYLLSIERTDWPKLDDMFEARDAKPYQPKFPVGFPVRVCALKKFIHHQFQNIAARIGWKCVI